MNTKISYLYRDASNYKVPNECIVRGLLTDEQTKAILDCLDRDNFIPSQVGLPERRFDRFDPEEDTCWFELYESGFEPTDAEATVFLHIPIEFRLHGQVNGPARLLRGVPHTDAPLRRRWPYHAGGHYGVRSGKPLSGIFPAVTRHPAIYRRHYRDFDLTLRAVLANRAGTEAEDAVNVRLTCEQGTFWLTFASDAPVRVSISELPQAISFAWGAFFDLPRKLPVIGGAIPGSIPNSFETMSSFYTSSDGKAWYSQKTSQLQKEAE